MKMFNNHTLWQLERAVSSHLELLSDEFHRLKEDFTNAIMCFDEGSMEIEKARWLMDKARKDLETFQDIVPTFMDALDASNQELLDFENDE